MGLVGIFACLGSVLVKARFSRPIIAILAIGAITVYEIVEATIRPADASVTHLLFTGFGVVLGYGLALLEGWLHRRIHRR